MATDATQKLRDAVFACDLATAGQALDGGADVDARVVADGRWGGRYEHKDTPLLIFAASGKAGWVKMVELLAKRGADLNAKCKKSGRTAVIAAAADGTKESVRFLIEAGADLNQIDKAGQGLLHLLVQDKKGIALLTQALAKGAKTDVGKKDKEMGVPGKATYTPLFAAVGQGNKDAVDALLAAGASPNTGKVGPSWIANPLGYAIKLKHKAIAKSLIQAGADLSLLDILSRAAALKLAPKAPG